MDSQSKTGKVYLQPHKTGKKWKPVWLSLFPQSSSGVGRLEIQDMGGGRAGGDHGAGVWRYHHPQLDRKLKVVHLSQLLSVVKLPPNAEACPMENMSAFCVETQERTVVFAALKDDCVDWVKKLCHSMFQGSDQLHMEDNQIYASANEDSEFWVVVQRTDAATRCGLQGSYWLQVGQEALLLRETQKKNIVREWPYKLLRRYGKDKLAFTIEAGRRCDSGPGSFTFETLQADKIFSMIQSTIKEKTAGNQNQESEKGSNIQAHSPLPKIPDLSSAATILENQLWTQERKHAALEESAHAPITLMPLPLIPTRGSQSGSQLDGQSEAVYSDPADCIQSVTKLQLSTGLYVDPAHVLPLQPPISVEASPPNSSKLSPGTDDDSPSSVYSEVYDKISTVKMKQSVQCSTDGEPIYTEPMVSTEVLHKKETRPDPFAHLYAQVCKATSSCSSSSSSSCSASASCAPASMSSTTTMEQSLDDVIYENLGII